MKISKKGTKIRIYDRKRKFHEIIAPGKASIEEDLLEYYKSLEKVGNAAAEFLNWEGELKSLGAMGKALSKLEFAVANIQYREKEASKIPSIGLQVEVSK